jgi:hypothetical protein
MIRTMRPYVCILTCLLAGVLQAWRPPPQSSAWHWSYVQYTAMSDADTNLLTDKNGEHAIGVTEYNDGSAKAYLSVLSERKGDNPGMYDWEYIDWGWDGSSFHWDRADSFPDFVEQGGQNTNHFLTRGQVAINSVNKLWGAIWRVDGGINGGTPTTALASNQPVTEQDYRYWQSPGQRWTEYNEDSCSASIVDGDYVVNVSTLFYENHNPGYALLCRYNDSRGRGGWSGNGSDPGEASPWANDPGVYTRPSLAVDEDHKLQLLYDDNSDHYPGIKYRFSTNWGATWDSLGSTPFGSGIDMDQPCVAALGDFVFGCYVSGNTIAYRYSTDNGANWVPQIGSSPSAVPFFGDDVPSGVTIDRPNVTLVTIGGRPALLLVVRMKVAPLGQEVVWAIRGMSARLIVGDDTILVWYPQPAICLDRKVTGSDGRLNPSIAGVNFTHGSAQYPNACYVASVPWAQAPDAGRFLLERQAFHGPLWQAVPSVEEVGANTARLLSLDADGSAHYAAMRYPYYEAGELIDGLPLYFGAGMGVCPALALDSDGNRWVSFIWNDSLYCQCPGEDAPRLIYGGAGTEVMGQPSLTCYPGQDNDAYVSAITFSTYDTSAGTSRIMFARACTTGVVLDTIESVANLRDSLPCINVYLSDSFIVTWQHGDSTLSSLLADYGPGTAGRPSAWASPSLVTASGHHPMSVMDGGVVNCLWDGQSGGNYSIQRATNDLGGGMFAGWVAQTPPSTATAVEKANSAYAGVGCSVWQQKNLSDKWVIKGFVRGAETTLVDNDTDAYHPHAVAESSGSTPSVDNIKLHLLYDAGVTFEVDSGVFDTGEVRYSQFDFPVSDAGANATAYNSGCKLIRQGDSLFSVYGDLDGSIVYAWSATGDSWQRAIMATSRDNPAIAEDSTGKRWVVMHKQPLGMYNGVQEAYYRNGSSWTGPETLYTAGAAAPIGRASVAGASSTTSSIAYATFLTTSGVNKSVVLAKFNGTVVSTYTVATGTSLGDPAIAVEPYKTDSDHVHVTWEDNGAIKYCMDTDGRGTGIASKWTAAYTLTGGGVVGHHPSIGANRSRIVVAWAQGTTADIYGRKRAASNAYMTIGLTQHASA